MGLGHQRCYDMLALLRTDPRPEALLPKVPGRREGQGILSNEMERLILRAMDAAGGAGEFAAVMREVNRLSAGESLKCPSRQTVKDRITAETAQRDEAQILVTSEAIRSLSGSWITVWSRGIKGPELKIGPHRVLVHPGQKVGWSYEVDGVASAWSHDKQDQAKAWGIAAALKKLIGAGQGDGP
jgi:hypothetical protein